MVAVMEYIVVPVAIFCHFTSCRAVVTLRRRKYAPFREESFPKEQRLRPLFIWLINAYNFGGGVF